MVENNRRVCRIVFVSTFLLLSLPLPAGDGDWPRWRGVNQNGAVKTSGTLKLEEGQGLKVAWKRELGSAYSSISIAGNRAVTMFSDGKDDFVVSLDAQTGQEQWRTKIGSMYVGHNGSHDGPNSTPLIHGNRVFALGPNGDLLAVNLKNGKEIWRTHIVEDHKGKIPFHGFTTSPLVSGNVLVVETGGDDFSICGFNKKTGKLLWTAGKDQVNYQSPVSVTLGGKDQVICAGNQFLYGLNAKTGETYWEFKHAGGGGSFNPLFFDRDKLVFTFNGRETMAIQIKSENGEYQVEELWRTRQFGRSFNDPVYHKGYFYSFSGRFLTCINAKDGALAWKSRPPGDGFLILVDDYLVIQTKRGSLHLAKASSDDYQEVASLNLFDSLTWTPPSFANGKIFARSLAHVASVTIDRVDQVIAEAPVRPAVMKVPQSGFARFVSELERSGNKAEKIEAYLAKQKSFPMVEDGRYAHLIYYGPAKDMAITGDMLDTGLELPMNHVAGTKLFYASFELEPDARLNYRFTRDFDNREPDPRNPNKVPSIAGEMSQLAMPKWTRPTHFDEPRTKNRGKMTSFDFESKIMENTRKVEVYTPAGYDSGSEKYPVVYVNYGQNAVQLGKMPNTLDNLIGKSIKPVIAVFIQAPNSFQEYARAQRDNYAKMVATELVPHIDRTFRTETSPSSRAFMGGDEGGYAAIYTAFNHKGIFGMLGGQSTHLLPNAGGDELMALLKETDKQPVRFYLDWGKYDYRNTAGNYNWTEFNQNLMDLLKKKGYSVAGGQHNESFGWASWRNRTDKILEQFFPLNVN